MIKIKLIELSTEEQFQSIKAGQRILVKWTETFLEHTHDADRIKSYQIYDVDYTDTIVRCQRMNQHQFDYNLYLQGRGNALEVYQIVNDNNSERNVPY